MIRRMRLRPGEQGAGKIECILETLITLLSNADVTLVNKTLIVNRLLIPVN